jgi:uncharacterized membrane protein HdeD (DUF308 family)
MTDQTPTPSPDLVSKASQIESEIEVITSNIATAVTVVAKANVLTAIIGFFTALPGIVRLIQQFMSWVNAVSGNNPQAYISNLGVIMSQLSTAKTKEERSNAAQSLSDLISKLPSK